MKVNSILASIVLLLFISCSKETLDGFVDEKPNEGDYLISFDVTGFSQDLIPFSEQIKAHNMSASAGGKSLLSLNNQLKGLSAQTTGEEETPTTPNIRDFINTIEIKVYRSTTLIDSVRQYADDPDFGRFAKYYSGTSSLAVFVAGAMLEDNGDLILRKDPKGQVTDTKLKILPDAVDAFSFYRFHDIKVAPKHENIKLKRFVGRVEVVLDEEIPADAARLDIAIENTAEYFIPAKERGFYLSTDASKDTVQHNTFKSIEIKAEDRGRTDYSAHAYFVLKSPLGSKPDTTNIILSAFRANGVLIQRRVVPNVVIQANKRTRLIGKLFTAPNLDFDFEFENDWSADIPEYDF